MVQTFIFIFLFLAVVSSSTASEADATRDCSDVLQNLVKRMGRLENREIQYQQQINAMKKRLAGQDQIVQSLMQELHTLKTEPKDDVTMDNTNDSEKPDVLTTKYMEETHDQIGQRIRRADVDMRVAFFATLSNHALHLGKNQNVAFDNIVTNVGNAYNPHAGLFIAPVAGTYVFSTDITALGRNSTHLGFARNGHTMTVIWVDGVENAFDTSSQTIVLQLQRGDDVSVQNMDSDRSLTGGSHCVFCGFLLYQASDDVGIIG